MRWMFVVAGAFCLAICIGTYPAVAQNSKVLMLVNNKDNIQRFDGPLISRLEWQHAAEVTVEAPAAIEAEALTELALEHDLVLIS